MVGGCWWLTKVDFIRSDELARHRRSHSGIKPYKCQVCSSCSSSSYSAFSSELFVFFHQSIVQNYQYCFLKWSYQFDCQVCSKRFARSDHLDKHIKIHSRDRTTGAVVNAFKRRSTADNHHLSSLFIKSIAWQIPPSCCDHKPELFFYLTPLYKCIKLL